MKDVESCNGKLSVSGQSVHNRSYGQDAQPISSFVLAFRGQLESVFRYNAEQYPQITQGGHLPAKSPNTSFNLQRC